jgi:dTMP kinase
VSFFLSFEGIDGCGKTTQLTLLHARLESAGHTVVATREPGGTALAEAIREYLLHSVQPLDKTTELLLFGAARAQHVTEVISPALERGTIVLSDRFADSSLAYQGGGLGIGADFIRRMNAFAAQGVRPDITIVLDVDPLVGLQRRTTQRGEDRIEERGLDFQRRVRDAFLDIARHEPERVIVLDGGAPAKIVHNRIVRALQQRELMSTTAS